MNWTLDETTGTREVSFTVDSQQRTVQMHLHETDCLPAETLTLHEAEVKDLLHQLAAKKWAKAPVTATPEERSTAMATPSQFEDNHD